MNNPDKSNSGKNTFSKKKVIRVIARLNVGGPAIHVILLTAGLNTEKFETILVSGREAPEEGNMLWLAEKKNVEPVIYEYLGRELNPIRDWSTFWDLYKLFKKEKPDIVHTHTAKAGTVGRAAAWLAGVPVIIHTFHGHVLHGYFHPVKEWVFRWIEKISGWLSTEIIAVSESCRNDLIKYKIAPAKKIKTIHLGLELERFRHLDESARATIRDEIGVPQDAVLVGMIARMVPIKRHEDLFIAIPKVLEKHPGTYFVMVGDGERRAELEALAHELNIAHRCVFTGFRDDQERIYATVDAVVLTSANEGLPVAVIEALSSGRPVIATKVGGVPELIEDGKTGFIVEPGKPESIAEGLIKAVADPQKLHEMGKTAQEETIRKFSINRLVNDIENLYDRLTGVAKE